LIILNVSDAETLIEKAEQNFKLIIKPDPLSKLLLLLTFSINKGVEIFSLGFFESRIPFMFTYGNLIRNALQKKYRVIVKKEGTLFNNAEWFLEFIKKEKF